MATVSKPAAPLGVVHTVLGVLAVSDTWHGEPVVDTFENIIESLAADDAEYLPIALGECLLALRGDPDRCRLALEIIRHFDLFEATFGLLLFLRECPLRDAVITAAAMANHPAAEPMLAPLVIEIAQELGESTEDRFNERVTGLLTGRLPEGASEATHLLVEERWPGIYGLAPGAMPLVVLTDDAGAKADELRLLVDLRRSGAHVRRLPGAVPEVPRGWLAPWAALVTCSSPPHWWRADRTAIRTQGSLSTSSRRTVLRKLRRQFKGVLRLRGPDFIESIPSFSDPLIDSSSFFDGALKVTEVSFLTGWAAATVRKRGRDFPELQPQSGRHGARLSFYDFAQTTALRVDNYIAATFGRRSRPSLAAQLVREARTSNSVPTHVTSDGEILFEYDGTVVDRGGQGRVPAIALDEIVRTFHLGSGKTVPELLHPSEHTEVHPSVQRGTPVVSDTRISALAVRDVAAWLRSSGLGGRELHRMVNEYFPELTSPQIDDADRLGQEILA